MPPHSVCPAQVIWMQVAPQVWTPPHWVCWPQVGKQVSPQVWMPPHSVRPGQVMMWQVWPQVWTPAHWVTY